MNFQEKVNLKFIMLFKRAFLSFPHLVQQKWKTLETIENTMVKTSEFRPAFVEIFEMQALGRMFETPLSECVARSLGESTAFPFAFP